MKFLERGTSKSNLMPLNVLYDAKEYWSDDDILEIVYKDMDSGAKYVQAIDKPYIEVHIVKPEFRHLYTTMRDYYPIEHMAPCKVRYKWRYKEISQILGMSDKDAVKASPLVAGSNIDIRTYYFMQFLMEYGNTEPKKLNLGFLDIESDVINAVKFESLGHPMNAVTFIDDSSAICWTLLLRSHGPTQIINTDTGKYYDNTEDIHKFEDNLPSFIETLHEMFDETYGSFNYQLSFYDDEVTMISDLFKIIEMSGADYTLVWNLPYDLGNIVDRPSYYGRDASEVLCSSMFKTQNVEFVGDNGPQAHKRSHKVNISHPTVWVDQMVIYAGIRSAMGTIPSLKLNNIAKLVLGDTKLDYSEEGQIRFFPYLNYEKFVLYNIKDVLLQVGIERKTRDMDDFYTRCYTNGLLSSQVFISTAMLTNSITMEFYKMGFIVGNNRNKVGDKYKDAYAAEVADYDVADYIDINEVEDESEEEEGTGNDTEKFAGAMVANTNRMLSTGATINGIENTKLHIHIIDQDVKALYPTLIQIMNLSNETMIGKLILNRDNEFFESHIMPKIQQKAPGIYSETDIISFKNDEEKYLYNRLPNHRYVFIDSEKSKYRLNIEDYFLSLMTENAIVELGEVFFGLGNFSDVDQFIMGDAALTEISLLKE